MRPMNHVAAVAMLLSACGSVLGQNALGDGRRLDANPSATQGRVNPRPAGIDEQIRFNNAVIYGTAPGGKSFGGYYSTLPPNARNLSGYAPYRAPDQFGGRLGSDDLYNFRRDSFTSGLASAGIRGSDALRYQFALTTGQQVPGFLAGSMGSVERSGTVSTGANAAANATALRSTSEFITGQTYRPSLVGVRQDEWGAEYVAKASPLLGVTWVKTTESPLGAPSGAPGVAPQPGAAPVPGSTPPGTPTAPGAPAVPGTATPGAVPASPTGVSTPVEKPAQPGLSGLEPAARAVGSVPDRAQSRVDTHVRAAAVESSSLGPVMDRFRQGFAETPKPGEAPGSRGAGTKPANEPQTLERQMERLHQMLRGEVDLKPADQKPTHNADGTTIVPDFPTAKPGAKPIAVPERPGFPTGKPGAAPEKPAPAPGRPRTLDALTPEVLRGIKKVGEKKVEHLVSPPPAKGADNADPEGYKVLMREGESLLEQGRFFDAEDRFVRSVATAPGDPLARAGRIHAEIGAGLYLSAAANLRALFADRPELVSTRFAEKLLPTPERSKVIVEQLLSEERKAESSLGRESALLVAYMGYQRSDADLVTKGLDDLEKRILPGEAGDKDRALLGLVRAAWTK